MKQIWKIDHDHSELMIQVRYLTITTISATIKNYDLSLTTEDNTFSSTSMIAFKASASAIKTNSPKMDEHLYSPDFFNAAAHQFITFEGENFDKGVIQRGQGFLHYISNEHSIDGEITIKNITRPITLKMFYNGTVTDHHGKTIAGFKVSGKLLRSDFDMNWGGNTITGKLILGDEVTIDGNIQLVKQEQNDIVPA